MRNQLLSLLLLSLLATSVLAKHKSELKKTHDNDDEAGAYDDGTETTIEIDDLINKVEEAKQELPEAQADLENLQNQLNDQEAQLNELRESLTDNTDPSQNSEIAEEIEQSQDKVESLEDQLAAENKIVEELEYNSGTEGEQEITYQENPQNTQENEEVDPFTSGFEEKSMKKNKKSSLRKGAAQKVLVAKE